MTVQSVFRKMSRLIQGEFGCTLAFTAESGMGQLPIENPEYLDVIRRNSGATRIYTGDDVIIPVVIEEQLIGAAVLVGGFNVRTVHVERLERILSDAFVKAYNGSSLSDSVQELEKYIESLNVTENVIFLADVKRIRRQKLRDLGFNHETLVGRPVFVHSNREEDLQKIAVDIHRELGSTGFVPWFALDHQALNSVESLRELGPVTIFVSELANLDNRQQVLVESLLSEGSSETIPQFIFGSQKSLNELVTSNGLTEGLARILEHSV